VLPKGRRRRSVQELATAHPSELWKRNREDKYRKHTSGICQGYIQTNLAILPKELAYDFLLFCNRNPKPCPVVDVTEPGSPVPRLAAPEADLRTDLGMYRVFKNGELVDEPTDISSYWRDDLVAFLLGCSLSFERALMANDIPLRHIELGLSAVAYISNIECVPAGIFHGPMVVSMRPLPPDKVVRAVQVTTRFPGTHGAPVHIGDPSVIGIEDLDNPEFVGRVPVHPGEVPVFWACGITPQVVAMRSKPELMITHSPGYMFVTSLKEEQLTVL
jgi:uncharacterized protein YcsI (UPF0317 family)